MKKIALIVGLASVAALSSAQARSSYLGVDSISGIDVTVSNGGLTYKIDVLSNPSFMFQSNQYDILHVIGFAVLSDDDDVIATNQNTGVWTTVANNSGAGGVAGWKTNPNTGLDPGQSFTFTFDSLNVASIERVGFDVFTEQLFPGTQGNTGRITTVPEPASMIALASGLAAFVVRRRRK